jgi:hypothetical protein
MSWSERPLTRRTGPPTEVQTEAPPRHTRVVPRVMKDPANPLSYSWMRSYSMGVMQEVGSSCVNFELDGQIRADCLARTCRAVIGWHQPRDAAKLS